MYRTWFNGASGLAVALMAALAVAGPAQAQQKWGTVKGQVVWAGGPVKLAPIEVKQDKAHCLKDGPLYPENIVVNPKNKGLKWVVVWLVDVDPAKATDPIPTHPSLAKATGKVVIDQPCCNYDPHVVTLRIGQSLVVKNPAPVPHNVDVKGGKIGPNLNPIIPPGKSVEVAAKEFKPRIIPIPVACSIHNWMKAYLCVFSHPYFAVTDADGNFVIKNAPQGKYRLVVWHEECGWVIGEKSPTKGGGKVINITATTDVGKIQAKPL